MKMFIVCFVSVLFVSEIGWSSCRIRAVSCVKGKVLSINELKTEKKSRFYAIELKVKSSVDLKEDPKSEFKRNDTIRAIVRDDRMEKLNLKKGKNSSLIIALICDDLGGYPREEGTPKLEASETCD